MTRPTRFPAARVLAIAFSLVACLSLSSCQMANYQLNRLMQIPRGILNVDADGLPRSGSAPVADTGTEAPSPAGTSAPAA